MLLAVGSRDTGGKISPCNFCRSWPKYLGISGGGSAAAVAWADSLLLKGTFCISQREQVFKCGRPYACLSAQSFPLFHNDGTGCAELKLSKYQPTLSRETTAFCTLQGLSTTNVARLILLSLVSTVIVVATKHPHSQGCHPLAHSSLNTAANSSLGRHSYACCFN